MEHQTDPKDLLERYQKMIEEQVAYIQSLPDGALELKYSLKAGDLIYCTEDAYFDYNEEIKARHVISQRVGDIIMVNNPGWKLNENGEKIWNGKGVGGNGIFSPYSKPGDRFKGLGQSFNDGTYRRAVPTDPGYVASYKEWKDYVGWPSAIEAHKLARKLAVYRLCAGVAFGYCVLRALAYYMGV